MHSTPTVETTAAAHLEDSEKGSYRITYPFFIVFAVALMLVALAYVGSHIHMTELEYSIAAEMSVQEQKMEEQKKLKLEYAMLKSPQRIESIAKNKLQMFYPEAEQIILLKK